MAAEAATLGTYAYDLTTGAAQYSAEFLSLYGLRPGDPLPLDAARVPLAVLPEDHDVFLKAIRASGDPAGDGSFRAEFRIRRPCGEVRWLMGLGRTTFVGPAQSRRSVRSAGVIMDITNYKRALETVQKQERQLYLFVKNAPAAIAMFDKEMRYIATSNRWLTDYGLTGQQLPGRRHYEVFPEIPEPWKQVHRRCLAGAVERAEEDPFRRADGSVQWLRWEVRPWLDGSGEIGGIIIFSEDITARKQAAEALRQEEERFRTLVESAPDAIFVQSEGRFVYLNPAMLRLLGASAPEEAPWDELHGSSGERIA